LVDAVSSNLVVVAALVAGAVLVPWWAARRATGAGDEPVPVLAGARPAALVAAVALLLLFGVARWLPALAWLAP
jgi:hypothetical protein